MKRTITLEQLKKELHSANEAVEDLNAGSSYDEIQSELEDADYESFCKQLSFLVKNKDPKSQALYNTFKEGWKDEYRDITVSEKFISIRDLHPTQNVIFANKSLVPMLNGKWQIGGKSAVEVVLSGKSVNIPLGDPLVVCNVGGTNYLIDGHHRWSKFYAFNPTCNLQAYIIEDKSGKGLFASADDVLKFAQGTLAALGQDTINPQSAGDTNMYDMDLAMLTDIVNKNTSPEILQIVIDSPVTGGLVRDKTTLANYLWQNLYTNMFEYAPAGVHDREYMPQYPSGMDPETAVDTISENTKFTMTIGQLRKLVKESRLNWNGPKVIKHNWDGEVGYATFRLGKIADEEYYHNPARRCPVDISISTDRGHFSASAEIGNANATSFNRSGQIIDIIADHDGYIYKQLPVSSQELVDKIAGWWKRYHLVDIDDIPEEDYDAISETIEHAKDYEAADGVVKESDDVKMQKEQLKKMVDEFDWCRDEIERGYWRMEYKLSRGTNGLDEHIVIYFRGQELFNLWEMDDGWDCYVDKATSGKMGLTKDDIRECLTMLDIPEDTEWWTNA